MALSVGEIIGIAVGGSAFLVIAVAGVVFATCQWRYNGLHIPTCHREEQGDLNCKQNVFFQNEWIPQPVSAPRASNMSRKSAYGASSSSEELTHPALRTRDSTAPLRASTKPYSNVRKTTQASCGQSGNDFLLQNLSASHLSAILESPTLSIKRSASQHEVSPTNGSSTRKDAAPTKTRKNKKRLTKTETPVQRPKTLHKSAEVIKPEPLYGSTRLPSFRKSVGTDGHIGILDDSMISLPKFPPAIHEDPFSTQSISASLSNLSRLRSASVVHQDSGIAPIDPPPPLPREASTKTVLLKQEPRPRSSGSAASHGTNESTVLREDLTSPSLSAKEDFLTRHRGIGLVPKLRQLEPDHVRDEVILGSRPASRQSVQIFPDHKLSQKSSREHAFLSLPACEQSDNPPSDGRTSRLSNRSTGSTRKKTPLSTPTRLGAKRKSQTVKASVTGSPVERKVYSGDEHLASNRVPLREISNTSTQSSSSLEGICYAAYMKNNSEEGMKSFKINGNPTSCVSHCTHSPTVQARVDSVNHCLVSCCAHVSGPNSIVEEPVNYVRPPQNERNANNTIVEPLPFFDEVIKAPPEATSSSTGRSSFIPLQQLNSTSEPHSLAFQRSGTPPMRLSHVSASSSTLMKKFPETPGKSNESHTFNKQESPLRSGATADLKRDYSEPHFVPPGLELAKLSRKNTENHDSRANCEKKHDLPSESEDIGGQHLSQYNAVPTSVQILSPSPKSSPTIGISTARSASPPTSVRMAPLSSTVNPFNTKPDLPPPYSTTSPVNPLRSSSTRLRGPRLVPGPNILKQVRDLRRSQLFPEETERTDSAQNIPGEANSSPTQEQMRWMRMREGSPTLPGRRAGGESPGPLLSLTHEADCGWGALSNNLL